MYNLKDFERVVWREEGSVERFKEWFFDESWTIVINSVHWSTTDIHITYYSSDNLIWDTTTYNYSVWEEFYNKYK